MPSACAELRAQWPGGDEEAIDYLKAQGYTLLRTWQWVKPGAEHEPTEREYSALSYLVDEWDFGWLVVPREAGSRVLVEAPPPPVGEAAIDEGR